MVGVVVVAHGHLGEALVEALASVVGPVEHIVAVSSAPGEAPEGLRDRIHAAVRGVDQGDGVLILTDMKGDTQTNQSLAVARASGAEVVAGVNMPMLVKLASGCEGMAVRELAPFIQRYGQEHIVWIPAPR